MRGWFFPTGGFTACAIAFGHTLAPYVPAPVAGTIGLVAAIFAAGCRGRRIRLPLVLALGATVGVLRTTSFPPLAIPAVEGNVAGRVVAWEPLDQGARVDIEVHRVAGRRLTPPRLARLWAPEGWPISPLSPWLAVTARVLPERGPTVPGGYSEKRFSARLTCSRTAHPVWGPGSPPRMDGLRHRLRGRVHRVVPGFGGRYAEAVLLGRSRALYPNEQRWFRQTGTAHLVAVSGLHVGLLAALVHLATGGAPVAVRSVLTSLACWMYALLAGGSPSALRAALLITLAMAGGATRRPRPAEHWLALALPLLLTADPLLLRALSFQLSVGAVAGILVAVDVARLHSHPRWLASAGVSLGAQWGTLPWGLSAFAAVAPLALLPNLVAVPLTGLFLPAVLLAVTGAAVPGVGLAWAQAAGTLAEAVGAVLRLSVDALPFYRTGGWVPQWLPWITLGGSLAWLALPTAIRRRGRARGIALSAMVSLSAACWWPQSVPAGPWVAFLDIGQGDAAVARLSDGTVWVVDLGDDRGPGDGATRGLLPFLRRTGIRRVEGVVLSHRHRDHVGGLASFLEAMPVERVWDAGYGGMRGTSGVLDSLLAHHRAWPSLAAAGDTIHAFDGGSLVAVHPPRGDPLLPPPGSGLNDASLVVRLVDGAFSVLFVGDAEHGAEAACLAGDGEVRARILKVGHHGSRTSSGSEFLDRVGAEVAVISAGEHNRFGHPDPRTLNALEKTGSRVYRTDRDGTVWVSLAAGGKIGARIHPPRKRGW